MCKWKKKEDELVFTTWPHLTSRRTYNKNKKTTQDLSTFKHQPPLLSNLFLFSLFKIQLFEFTSSLPSLHFSCFPAEGDFLLPFTHSCNFSIGLSVFETLMHYELAQFSYQFRFMTQIVQFCS